MADVKDQSALLTTLVQNFDAWFDATRDAREESQEARDYYDGNQWTDEEQQTLQKRKQPVLTDNKIKDKIDYMIGMEIGSRTDPKAFPRTPTHEQDAEAITDALRYIGDSQDFPKIRSDVAENHFVEGMGGAEVYVKKSKTGIDVCIKRNRFERCYWDPHSCEKDFSDARYLGTFVWMDVEAAAEMWPEKNELWASYSERGTTGDSDSDRPSDNLHTDRKGKRVRVLEQYFLYQKQWYRAKFVKHGWIETPEPSAYLDDEGEPENPYCWGSAYVDKENNRYGVVRRWKSLQDEINHRRSKSLHLLNTNQVIMEDGAVNDVQKLKEELAKPDGVITRTPGMELEVNKNLDLSAGHFQMMQQAIEALSIVGPKAITNVSASQSGRAKQLDRQSDALEMGRLFDHLRGLQKQVYRKAWHRIKQYWTEEKWVRVRDDEGAPKFVQLNAPVSAQDMMQTAQQHGIEIHPMLAQIAQVTPTKTMAVRNNVAELDVDIIIDEMPDAITLQDEQFQNLVTLAQAGVIFPPDVYIDASNLRNKKQVKEKLSGGDDPAMQQAAAVEKQMQDRMKEAQVAKAEAEAGKTGEETKQLQIENTAGQAALAGMAQG